MDEGNPVSNMVHYLITGVGEIALVTREVLREAERTSSGDPSSTSLDCS